MAIVTSKGRHIVLSAPFHENIRRPTYLTRLYDNVLYYMERKDTFHITHRLYKTNKTLFLSMYVAFFFIYEN